MRVFIDEHPENINLAEALSSVSMQRRNHALHYRQEHDRRLSLSAYVLLQKALQQEFGILDPPIFNYSPQGKPLLRDYPDIHFSLSHCRQATACVIDSQPVGIDIESIDAYREDIVDVTMNKKEQEMIATAPSCALAFIRLWTQKESLLKFTGQGMTDNLLEVLNTDIPHTFHTREKLSSGYVITVCH